MHTTLQIPLVTTRTTPISVYLKILRSHTYSLVNPAISTLPFTKTGRRKNRQRDAETECEWVTCESLDITEHLTRKPPNTTTKAPRPPESTASMCVYEQGCEEVDIEMYQPSHRQTTNQIRVHDNRKSQGAHRQRGVCGVVELYDRLQTQRERRDAETERKSCDVATHTNIQQTSDTGRE
ncbi:hypothetical protein SARC_06688, partial [Sphaeroforma arctica JP610]